MPSGENTMKNLSSVLELARWALFLSSAIAAFIGAAPRARAQERYTASWASVDKHTPAPEWFQDAKLGIYYHWGPFGMAQYGSEWYPRNMYDRNSGEYRNQTSKYGDPFGDWPYDKFITGANDKSGEFTQFAPKLASEGGHWDPDAWAQMLVDAGARFAGPVAEHHDGFSMWDSKVNEWNSVSTGPKLNLLKLQADAYRKKGLKFLASLHHAFNFTGFYEFAPNPSDPSLKKLYGKLDGAAEQQLWLDKLKEVIDQVLPDVIWQDFNLGRINESKRLEFLAYYYNAALDAKKEVVATYKDGFNTKGEVLDYERGGPGDISSPYWLTDDAVSEQSWCYVQNMGYYSDGQLVHAFIDRVSKNGNLLLNISPQPDGTIPQRQKDILSAFGKFLKQAGTAIYNTRAWVVYGEGPTKMGGGSFTAPKQGTASDVRYTKSKDGDAVYAILLGWPGNDKKVTLAAVTTSRFPVGSGKVFLFGPVGESAISLSFKQDGSGLQVTMPSTQPYTAIAYAMKISKSGTAPAPTPETDAGSSGSDAGQDAGRGAADASVTGGDAGITGDAAVTGDARGNGDPDRTHDAAVATDAGRFDSGVDAGGADTGVDERTGEDAGGCSCVTHGSGSSNSTASLLLVGLVIASMVRRRRRSSCERDFTLS
jgi:alpha-L-fucosidase